MSTSSTTPNRYTSRKFFTMVGAVGLFTGLLVTDHIPPDVYQTLMFISIGGYLASNVSQKFAERK